MRRTSGLIALVLLAPAAAQAATCTTSATPVVFGVYNPFSATSSDSTGTVTVSCTMANNNPYTVYLSMGGGGSYSGRQMNSGSSTLSYQLYTNPSRTIIWGDGTGATSYDSGTANGNSYNAHYTIYGRILAQQLTVISGNYTDVITVTITY